MNQARDKLMVFWNTNTRHYFLDLLKPEYLNLIGIYSLSEIKKIEISTNFLPEPYSNTDRAKMPQNYLCLGSGSAVFHCMDGQICYICLVGFYHSGSQSNHNNFWLWGRKKDGELVYENKIGEGHIIPVSEDVQIKIVLNNEEKSATIKRK
jgi:hypothetical protein